MASLNEIRRARKKGFVRIRQGLRSVDTAVEAAQRFVQRKLNLKRSIIEAADMDRLLTILRAIDAALRAVIKIIEAIRGVFT